MTSRILANIAISAYGESVTALNRNEPAFCYAPAEAYKLMMDRLEDLELISLVNERESEESISVDIDDL
ncbi:antitoxin [Vibrio sp. UCD-FRSSP16_10]|uniref:antitoxin n=1 Tax=unclassified Vibrio TaxID=2614977 RepID=UPI0008007993|nr:antitoxin [Vibrio sp. UCD-FRSSP16_30]OBT13404.1 antitoxin [Vibrio sp. UCD-FRSSP16_10]OBT17914.1 antitoxin [Vibrio sp. UCD-FRSSP16_30]